LSRVSPQFARNTKGLWRTPQRRDGSSGLPRDGDREKKFRRLSGS
jgi:hypothetical protein